MPFWVVTDERDLLGPYETAGRAQAVKDGLDCSSEVRETVAYRRSVAVQELRHRDVEDSGISAGHKNFKHGGVR